MKNIEKGEVRSHNKVR